MTRTIEIKINKTVFKFIETIYEEEQQYYLRIVELKYKGQKIKLKIEMFDHNPPHVHIIYNDKYKFRYKFDKNEFYKSDIKGNKGFDKLKKNKILFEALNMYLDISKNILIESFYILNPTLKTK